MATRWGICSAGKISTDFCNALVSLPAEEHKVGTWYHQGLYSQEGMWALSGRPYPHLSHITQSSALCFFQGAQFHLQELLTDVVYEPVDFFREPQENSREL